MNVLHATTEGVGVGEEVNAPEVAVEVREKEANEEGEEGEEGEMDEVGVEDELGGIL